MRAKLSSREAVDVVRQRTGVTVSAKTIERNAPRYEFLGRVYYDEEDVASWAERSLRKVPTKALRKPLRKGTAGRI